MSIPSLFLALVIPLAFAGCQSPAAAKAEKDFFDSTDVTFGVEYGGASARAGIINGRKSVAVDVDAKRVVKTLRSR